MTAGDAVQVSDINSQQNTEPSDVGEIVEANGYAYIVENDEATTNLWRSDGTTSEMITIPELTFAPYNLTVYNDQLYFVGFTDAHGSEIWRTDWTTTERVTDINAGGASNPQELTPLGDYLYFSANDGLNGSLWRFDGVTTEQVLDGDSSVLLSPHDLFVHNGYLYFSASSGVWRTNGGTPEEITKADTGTSISGAARFTVAVDKVFFRGSDPDTGNGRELWVAGGTTATRLTDINPGGGSLVFDNFVSMNQWLYFTIKDNMNGTLELWRSDGTTTNTAFRLALNPTDGHFTAYQNHIYFTHTTPETGQELWLTDGNTIELFEDLNPGPEWSYIDKLIELNGKLVFEADDGGRLGKEVWVSNGVTSEIIRNINNDGGVSADFLYVNGNRLYFLADDGVHGDEPWVLEINN
jgi:ELWxxDGT repeat protein